MYLFKPSHCFCHYDVRDLLVLAKEKFHNKRKTVDMMHEARSDEERNRVAILALLDLDDEQVLRVLADRIEGPNCDILSCRDMLRKQIAVMLAVDTGQIDA